MYIFRAIDGEESLFALGESLKLIGFLEKVSPRGEDDFPMHLSHSECRRIDPMSIRQVWRQSATDVTLPRTI